MQITISHDNQKQTFQLDYFPELTVGKIASLISHAFGFKDDILLMTNDNNILFPDIKFAELLLMNPDKYKYLKIHLSKEQLNAPVLMNTNIPNSNTNNIGSYSTPVSVTSSITNPPKLKSNFEIKNPLQKDQSDIMANNNISNTNKDFPSYKFDKNLLNKDFTEPQQQRTNLSSGMNMNIGLRNNNTNEDNDPNDFMQHPKVQMPPQKFVSDRFGEEPSTGSTPTYKPFKNQKIGGIGQHTPPTQHNEMGVKMEYKKFGQFEPKTQTQTFSSKFDLIDPSNLNVKDKDIPTNTSNNDLSNPSSNYIFNSGELYSYETLKKTTQKGNNNIPSSLTMDDQQKPFHYNTNMNSNNTSNIPSHNVTASVGGGFGLPPAQKTDSNIFAEPQPTVHKEEYKRFSSEKRTYRTERTNLMTNNPTGNNSLGGGIPSTNVNTNQDEYQPRQYQKYTQASSGLDDMSTRFPTEKINRYSSRPASSNPNSVSNLNKDMKDDNNNAGMNFASLGNKMSLRANLGNMGTMGEFNFDKKPPQQGRSNKFEAQPPLMKYKPDMFKMNMQMGNEEDNSAE